MEPKEISIDARYWVRGPDEEQPYVAAVVAPSKAVLDHWVCRKHDGKRVLIASEDFLRAAGTDE